MYNTKITSEWTCECLTNNPLRLKRCAVCGKEIPYRIIEKIYHEEIKVQKDYIYNEHLNKATIRCNKYGERMQKMQKIIAPITIALIVICTGLRNYYFPQDIKNDIKQYQMLREERFMTDISGMGDKLTGWKSSCLIVKRTLENSKEAVSVVVDRLFDGSKRKYKNLNEKKFIKIQKKIRTVINYVTRKFK